MTAASAAVAACSSGNAGNPAPLQASYESTITRVLPSVVEIDAGHSTGSGVVLDRHGTGAGVLGNVALNDEDDCRTVVMIVPWYDAARLDIEPPQPQQAVFDVGDNPDRVRAGLLPYVQQHGRRIVDARTRHGRRRAILDARHVPQ